MDEREDADDARQREKQATKTLGEQKQNKNRDEGKQKIQTEILICEGGRY